MPGLADRTTFSEFARRARAGQLLPDPGERRVTQGSAPLRLPPVLGRQLVLAVVADIKSRFMTSTDPRGQRWRPLKHPRPRGGTKPLQDTGRLMASITGRVEPAAIVVGTAHPGAAIQNFGGVVRAKKKMLAIPLTKEAQRAGSPRRFKGGLDFRATGKRRVFVLGIFRGARFVGMFLLVDSVTVPRREFMGLSAKGLAVVADILAAAGFQTLDARNS